MTDFHYQIVTGHDGGGDEYTELYWTTEPPKEPGIYWACMDAGKPLMCQVDFFGCGESGVLWVYLTGHGRAYDLSMFSHWLGPLPEPEAPK